MRPFAACTGKGPTGESSISAGSVTRWPANDRALRNETGLVLSEAARARGASSSHVPGSLRDGEPKKLTAMIVPATLAKSTKNPIASGGGLRSQLRLLESGEASAAPSLEGSGVIPLSRPDIVTSALTAAS